MIIYFAGSRLDHGDADQTSTTEADALARRTASPPVVVRGYDSAGNPIARIRAGTRIDDAVEIAAADVPALASRGPAASSGSTPFMTCTAQQKPALSFHAGAIGTGHRLGAGPRSIFGPAR
jgi:hypothetical protein